MYLRDYYTISESAEIVGVSRKTIHLWINEGKLKPEPAWGRSFLTLAQLKPFVVHKCSNCYHERRENGTNCCACRETCDMEDGCKDWVWKWN